MNNLTIKVNSFGEDSIDVEFFLNGVYLGQELDIEFSATEKWIDEPIRAKIDTIEFICGKWEVYSDAD